MESYRNEIGEIFRIAYSNYSSKKKLSLQHKKIAKDIMECRTSKKGGHKLICAECKDEKISYNSCKNRHCPKCQFSKREQWILDRNRDLLPVDYFHVIFTLPHELNGLHLKYTRSMYDILFKSTWAAVREAVKQQYSQSGQTGMIAVMHSWGQQLQVHPHLHCIIPSGIYERNQNKWSGSKKQNFLCSIEQLCKSFKAHYLKELLRLKRLELINHQNWEYLYSIIKEKIFNVNIRPRFSNPDHVIAYLARYSHKVAITNARIVQVTQENVSFRYLDYRDNEEKERTLLPEEFIRRFLLHIIPTRFMKIRHFGILSNKIKNQCIEAILKILQKRRNPKNIFDVAQYFLENWDENIKICKNCKKITQQIREIIPKVRSDLEHYLK